MRVIQLIDSLQPGGAERMAVTLANELSAVIDKSFLCSTREEGLLLCTINENVSYLFLKKKGTLDLGAFRRLFMFISKNNIDIIHAHSSSFFFACIIKLCKPKIKVIWHDHYGNSEMLNQRKNVALKICSNFFTAIISVNDQLKNWALKSLKCKRVYFLNNFVSQKTVSEREVLLNGKEGFRIICLANLRPQKDHLNLLKAFSIVKNQDNLASLHLVGEIHNDQYYKSLLSFIRDKNLEDVYFYGVQKDALGLLKDAQIGVLSSMSEGLPVSLLEYGLAGLAVVCTDVGQCKEVVNNFGKVVAPNDPKALAKALLYYGSHIKVAKLDAKSFGQHIEQYYSFNSIAPKLLEIYNNEGD